eukprot:4395467-Ditylum_brightwellii.AAC.1
MKNGVSPKTVSPPVENTSSSTKDTAASSKTGSSPSNEIGDSSEIGISQLSENNNSKDNRLSNENDVHTKTRCTSQNNSVTTKNDVRSKNTSTLSNESGDVTKIRLSPLNENDESTNNALSPSTNEQEACAEIGLPVSKNIAAPVINNEKSHKNGVSPSKIGKSSPKTREAFANKANMKNDSSPSSTTAKEIKETKKRKIISAPPSPSCTTSLDKSAVSKGKNTNIKQKVIHSNVVKTAAVIADAEIISDAQKTSPSNATVVPKLHLTRVDTTTTSKSSSDMSRIRTASTPTTSSITTCTDALNKTRSSCNVPIAPYESTFTLVTSSIAKSPALVAPTLCTKSPPPSSITKSSTTNATESSTQKVA